MEIAETTHHSVEAKTTRKKPNWRRISIVIFAVLAVILIILVIYIATQKNSTSREMLNITYSIKSENGTLIYSNTDSFEKNSLSSKLGFATNKIDNETQNIKEGETKTITLESDDAFGEYNELFVSEIPRTEKVNRTFEINRTIWITVENFQTAFNEQPILNKNYSVQGMSTPYKVVELNSTHVKLSQEAELNQIIPYTTFANYKIIDVNESKITLRIDGNSTTVPTENGNMEVSFTDNEMILTLTPQIGQEVNLGLFPAIVTGMNSTHLFLDGNHPLAGKKIIVEVTLNKITKIKTKISGKSVSSSAPTMQVFIMSYCPYGLQMLKGLLPVWEEFQDKANIELRFVSYTMHGQKEEDENNRMICIREEQNSKLIDYLKCFAESGDYSSCLEEAEIDISKLDSCMSSRVDGYFEEDKALNEQYGVQGSPTVIINSKEAQISRSPSDVKEALCNAFESKPSECSIAFSSASPTSGFGSGTTSSNQAAECS